MNAILDIITIIVALVAIFVSFYAIFHDRDHHLRSRRDTWKG